MSQNKNKIFLEEKSRIIWWKAFEKLGFSEFEYKLLPKKIKNEKNKQNFFKIFKRLVSRKVVDGDGIRMIINGDHDEKEIRHKKVLEERDPQFKIEKLMKAILQHGRINKNCLKKTLGTSKPTLQKLFEIKKIEPLEEITNFISKQIKKSNHPLLRKIWELSPINKSSNFKNM